MGEACRTEPESTTESEDTTAPEISCDGKDAKEKYHKWNLPIREFVSEEAGEEQICLFTPRWEPIKCDQTHCVIVLTLDGEDVIDFSTLPQKVRVSLHEHLKREGKK